MGRKSFRAAWLERSRDVPATARARIREDLECRGVAPEFAVPVSARLVELADDLEPESYAAVLDGVAAAYGVHRADRSRVARDESVEIHQLIHDFAVELKKLDEGLRILSAYLLKIRDRARNRGEALLLH
jgi:hypothetical protein